MSVTGPARLTGRPALPGRLAAAACTGLLVLSLGPSAGAAAATADPEPDGAPSSRSQVLVVERDPGSDVAEQLVVRLGGRVKEQVPERGGFEARLPAGTLLPVKASPAVLAVERLETDPVTGAAGCTATDPACFDTLPQTAIWQQAIGLDQIPDDTPDDGLTVAVLDTGVTPGPDLGARLLARVDLTAEHDGLDRFGHGSHLLGLVAGDGTQSLERYTGAAGDVDVVSVKVAGWDGATDVSTVIAGLHWTVANASRFGIRVVNLSYGTDAGPAADSPLAAAVEQAWRAGIVVVVSAGNAGPPTAGSTVTAPGTDPFAITVGAADTAGTANPADDAVAAFSSRGPGGKPDLLAPGVALVGLRAPGSTIDTFRAPARVGADYFRGSGTSQAAAVLAGVAARILAANPALTPDQVKGILLATTDRTLAGPAGGAGLVDAASAVALATSGGPLPVANRDAVRSAGTASLDAVRGTQRVWADSDGDGIPTALDSETDALGRPWTAAEVTTAWTAATWAASPWSAVTAEVAGSLPALAWTGARISPVSWEPAYFGATDPVAAGWDGRYWGGRYWGGRYWGSGMWQ